MPTKHSNINKRFFYFSISIVILLLLSLLNIRNYFLPKAVLGIKTQAKSLNEEFWNEYLKNNPNYVPGWLEIGRVDKALQIDPNYFPSSK